MVCSQELRNDSALLAGGESAQAPHKLKAEATRQPHFRKKHTSLLPVTSITVNIKRLRNKNVILMILSSSWSFPEDLPFKKIFLASQNNCSLFKFKSKEQKQQQKKTPFSKHNLTTEITQQHERISEIILLCKIKQQKTPALDRMLDRMSFNIWNGIEHNGIVLSYEE